MSEPNGILPPEHLRELRKTLESEDHPSDIQDMDNVLNEARDALRFDDVRAMAVLMIDAEGELVFEYVGFRGNLYRAAITEAMRSVADDTTAFGGTGFAEEGFPENFGGSGGVDDEDDDDD